MYIKKALTHQKCQLLIFPYLFHFRYWSKRYGHDGASVGSTHDCHLDGITEKALTAPMIAILTKSLSPAVGRFGKLCGISLSPVMNICFFGQHPSPEKILNRIARLIPSELCVCHKTATEFYARNMEMKVPLLENSNLTNTDYWGTVQLFISSCLWKIQKSQFSFAKYPNYVLSCPYFCFQDCQFVMMR